MQKVEEIFKRSKDKTAKVNKRFTGERNRRYSLYKDTEASLSAPINFRDIVKVPAGEDADDFLATNMVDFYSRAKLLYSTIADSNPNLKSRFPL